MFYVKKRINFSFSILHLHACLPIYKQKRWMFNVQRFFYMVKKYKLVTRVLPGCFLIVC